MDDSEIWRTAADLVEQHGHEALFVAAERVNALCDQGDEAGAEDWVRVVRAIEFMATQDAAADGCVNEHKEAPAESGRSIARQTRQRP